MHANICQAMPVTRPGPSKVAPAPSGPLVRPHGFSQARRTVPYAFNPALDSFGDGMGVPMTSFVRPDCPPDAEDVSTAPQKKEKRAKAASQGARPQFRSALEQVAALSSTFYLLFTAALSAECRASQGCVRESAARAHFFLCMVFVGGAAFYNAR